MSIFIVIALGIVAIPIIGLVCLVLYLKRAAGGSLVWPKPAMPGPDRAAFEAQLRSQRSDVFVDTAKSWGPTFTLQDVVITADASLAARVFSAAEHCITRSVLYRLLGTICPAFDGVLSKAGEEWTARRKLFAQQFRAKTADDLADIIAQETHTMAAIAVLLQTPAADRDALVDSFAQQSPLTAGRVQALRGAAQWDAGVKAPTGAADPASGVIPEALPRVDYARWRATPVGVDPSTAEDALSMCKWIAQRTLLAWTLGLDPELPLTRCLAREWDLYMRILQGAIPYVGAVGKAKLYWALWRCVWRQQALVRDIMAHHGADVSKSSFLCAMREAGWSLWDITSELNHIHGAHKAVALVTACSLHELSQPSAADWRRRLIAQLSKARGPDPLAVLPRSLVDADASDSIARAVLHESLRHHVVSFGVMRKLGCPEAVFVRAGPPAPGCDAPARCPFSQASVDGPPAGSAFAAASDTQLVGLPVDSEVQVWLHALHHDPGAWGDSAGTWDPARWTNGAADEPAAKASFMPFLTGRRPCAGQPIARREWLSMVSVLLLDWDFQVSLRGPLRKLPDMFAGIDGPVPYTLRPVHA